MSVGTHSGPAASGTRPTAGGDAPWRRRLRFFFAVLRARPSFALGYAIVVGVTVIAALAPWIVPFDPMTADPAVYLLPPGADTCWAPTAPAWISSAACSTRRASTSPSP